MISALAWALQGNRRYMVLAGGIFLALPEIVGGLLPALPYVGLIPMALQAFMICYVAMYAHSIIRDTAGGKETVDLWPDVSDGHALMQGLVEAVVPLVVSFLPLIVAFVVCRVREQPAPLALVAILAGVGIVYCPVAYTLEMFWGQPAVFNVVAAVRTIFAMGADYFAAVALILVLVAAGWASGYAISRLPNAPGTILGCMVGLYVLMASMRAVGLLYARHKQKLAWER